MFVCLLSLLLSERENRGGKAERGGGWEQGRATNPVLEKGDTERLFREHVNNLHRRAVAAFVELLDQVPLPQKTLQ
jgi:hypothetical protein